MKYKKILIVPFFIFFTALVFWGLWDVYFQQDEWSGFGRAIYAQKYGSLSLIRFAGSHFTPLTTQFFGLLYNFFGLNHLFYTLYSLFLHGINSFLVYMLATKLLKNKAAAVVAGIFFAISYTSQQAVTWYAASMAFLPSGLFCLVALLFFEKFLKDHKSKFLILAVGTAILGALFRENAIFLLAYFPVRSFLLKHRFDKKVFLSSTTAGVFYLVTRFSPLLAGKELTSLSGDTFNFLEIPRQAVEFIFSYLPRLLIPEIFVRFFVQSFFGSQFQFLLEGTFFINLFYALVFLTIAAFLFFFRSKTVYSLFLFLILSVLPFSFLPRPYIMESRHFYLSSIGSSLLLGYFFLLAINKTPGLKKTIIASLFVFYALFNILLIQREIILLRLKSEVEIKIVAQLTSIYQEIPSKAIFLAQKDPLPFQSGPGQRLMVLFHQKNDYTAQLNTRFLWELNDQGYSEIDGLGFGFFRDFSAFQSEYCEGDLEKDNVFSFSWNSAEEKIIDTSLATKKKLSCLH